MLMKAVKWSNGMVMAFDELGKQIPDLQGRFVDVVDKVKRDKFTVTQYAHGDFPSGSTWPITEAEFFGRDVTLFGSHVATDEDRAADDGNPLAALSGIAEAISPGSTDDLTSLDTSDTPDDSFTGGGGDFGGGGASGDF